MSGLTVSCPLPLPLLVLVVAGVMSALAIPSSLLTDVKQAESHNRMSNKVKRAQEVIMFGNQQNRGGDGRNAYALPRAEKRGVDLDSNVVAEAATEQPTVPEDVMDGDSDSDGEGVISLPAYYNNYQMGRMEPDYSHRLQNAVLKSEYYTDPATLTGLKYYDLDERRKRDTFRTPSKRSSHGLATGRAKRDLNDLEPEELYALLNYYGRRNKLQQNRNLMNQYRLLDSGDLDVIENPEDGNEISDDDEWMNGPMAFPTRHFSVPGETWGNQRLSEDRRKRFMVSKRNVDDGEMYSLAQLLNSPPRDLTSVYRRYAL